MSDRIFSLIVIGVGLLMMWATTLIEESFIQDPLGPKAFPIIVAAIMIIASIFIFLKPDPEPQWPELKKWLEIFFTLGMLIAYAFLLPILGFVVSTCAITVFLSWRLGARPQQAIQGGIGIALSVYGLFQYLLGLHLAQGPWGF